MGFIGYPNTGKSSIINTLKSKKVCQVAPIPGETKVWQYITLMKRLYLIDCPGIVQPGATDSETDIVLKGVIRIESIKHPEDHIPAVLERVKKEYIQRTYGVLEWEDHIDFLTQFARKSGKLHKGGEADLHTVSKMILKDWLRGNIPFFVAPPYAKDREGATEEDVKPNAARHAVPGVEQKLSKIRVEANFVKEDLVDQFADETREEEKQEEEETAVDYDEVFDEIEAEIVSEVPDEKEPDSKKQKHASDENENVLDEDATNAVEGFESEEEKPAPKEKRMKTNKKKVGVHYYDEANVKNKNVSKKGKDAAARRKDPKLLEKKLKGDGKRRN